MKIKITLSLESSLVTRAREILNSPPKQSLSSFVEEHLKNLIQRNFHPTCENCGHSMTRDDFENVNARTSGFIVTADEFDEFGNICFDCAKKLNMKQWIREGAKKTEYYLGLDK